MNSVLITGGTGAFGQAFTQYLLKETSTQRIVIFSRGEFAQHLMQEKFAICAERLRFMIGDVRDEDRLRHALQDVDTVVHAAALKRIEVEEYNPEELVQTNIDGTRNLIRAAHDAGVHKLILLSTDKAFQAVNLYGATKFVAEKLFINANNTRGWRGPIFAVCRYGNIWNSTGSVVPRWWACIKQGKPIEITDPECTRFYMTLSQAIELVMKTYNVMTENDRCPHIPPLPAYRLGDLAMAMGGEQKNIGLPLREKLHESLDDGYSSDKVHRLLVPELVEALRGTGP